MPVRSLNSSVLKWPDRDQVERSVRQWAAELAVARADLLRVGYFGSYARGDWGVGSDLDLVVVLRTSEKPFDQRAQSIDATNLAVAADVLVYTEDEWQRKVKESGRFARALAQETVWVYPVASREHSTVDTSAN